MPEIYLYGTKEVPKTFGSSPNEIARLIIDKFRALPVCRNDAVLIRVESSAEDANNKQTPFVRIEGSREMSDSDLIEIANHFLETIDVSIRNGKGTMVFRDKGKTFEPGCLDLPAHGHATPDIIGPGFHGREEP